MSLKRKLVFILILIVSYIKSQEYEFKESTNNHDLKHHRISLMLGHTHVSQGVQNGGKKWEVLPSVALGYDYWLNKNWAVGVHTDIVIETYEVEKHLNSEKEEILEREYPISPAIMGIYKPKKHFSYQIGVGGEFAKTENLFLIRSEIAYGIHILKEFEVETSVSYDLRFNAYDSWGIAIGISKFL